MNGENLDTLCQHCGQALANFLQEMKEHNAKVVCPTCGEEQDEGDQAGKPDGKGGMPRPKRAGGKEGRGNFKPASSRKI